MKFTLVTEVGHPREDVFCAQRDHMPDLVRYMPNVESIERTEWVEEGELVRLSNRWTGSPDELPAMIRSLLKPEWLTWTDSAVWDAARWECRWETHLNIFPGAISSTGTTRMEDEGSETVVTVEGDFSIDPRKVTAISQGLARRVAPVLERFVVAMVEQNLRRTYGAIEDYIDEGSS